jgi:small subunit ribosomal protein S16
MVRIRLRRTGKKNQASFRVVVADSESPRDGRFIENIGFYNPRTDPPIIEIEADRARYWLSQGAQPSEPAARLLRKVGVLPEIDYDTGEPVESSAELVERLDADAATAAEVEAELDADAAPAAEVEAEEEPDADAATAAEVEAEEEPDADAAAAAEVEAEEEPDADAAAAAEVEAEEEPDADAAAAAEEEA